MTLSLFFQLLIGGLAIGILYVLIVLGIDLILRVTRILNFAHGQIYMFGAYAFFYANAVLHINFAIGLVLTGMAMFLTGAICYVLIFHWVQRRFRPGEAFIYQALMSCMASVGLMMILSQVATLVFGTLPRVVPPIFPQMLSIGKVSIPADKMSIIIVSLLIMVGLYFLMFKTKLGKSMRAVSLDSEVSSLYGINPFRTYLLGFAIGCGLAGLAGGMIAPVFAVSTDIGAGTIFTAMVIMIMGGIGSYKGTIFAGLIVGLMLSFGTYFIGGHSELLVFVALIILLIFRPGGLFGEALD